MTFKMFGIPSSTTLKRWTYITTYLDIVRQQQHLRIHLQENRASSLSLYKLPLILSLLPATSSVFTKGPVRLLNTEIYVKCAWENSHRISIFL